MKENQPDNSAISPDSENLHNPAPPDGGMSVEREKRERWRKELLQARDENEDLTDEDLALLRRADLRVFNPTTPPKEAITVLSLAGVSVCRVGGLSVIQGPDKVGKSSFQEGAVAAAIEKGSANDTLGWKRETGRKMVLHLDCEQSEADWWSFCVRARNRAGISGFDPVFQSLHIKSYPPAERLALIALIMEDSRNVSLADYAENWEDEDEGEGIGLVLIDGFGDLVENVNDLGEATRVVAELMRLADKHKTHIIGSLHINPATAPGQGSKARGHLGSELYRKADTVIELQRKRDGSVIAFTARARKVPIPKESAFRMGFNPAAGRWETLAGEQESKLIEGVTEFLPLLRAAWGEDSSATYGYAELARIFATTLGKSESLGKAKISQGTKAGLIRTLTNSKGKNAYGLDALGITVLSADNPHK